MRSKVSKQFSRILLSGILIFSHTVQAGVFNNNGTPPVPTPVPTPVNPQVNGGAGLQQNGQNAANNQGAAMAMALASMALAAAMAAATCGKPGQEAMCAASILGAATAGIAAAMMNKAKNKSSAQVANTTAGVTPTNQTPITENRSYQESVRKLTEAAKNGGHEVDVDKGTAKLSDGRTLKTSDMGSASSMAKAGMKGSEIKAFGDLMKEIAKKAEDIPKAADGAPGAAEEGGGSMTVMSGGDTGGGGSGKGRTPASVAGATKNFNGTPIGVSVESIWVMMNRRYTHEAQGKKFLAN